MKTWLILMVIAAAALGWLNFRIEARKSGIDAVMSAAAQCSRLALGMSREDAVATMGQPVEEKPAYSARRVLATRLRFNSPERSPDWPVVFLDMKSSRVV